MKRGFIAFLFLVFCLLLHAQVDTKGTDFWFGIMGRPSGEGTVSIRIVGDKQATVGTIYFTNLGVSVPFSLAVGQVFTHNLTDIQKRAVQSTTAGISNRSVHITTSSPVTVYVMYAASSVACDVTNILPTTALGTDYYQITYIPNKFSSDYLIVAVQNNTNVFENNGTTPIATLNMGEVYYRTNKTDNTGTHVVTNNPAAFISATGGAQIPAGFTAVDNLLQQLAPVNTWGKNFFVPVSNRMRDFVRIVASQNGTNITQTGGNIRNVEGGQTSLSNLNAGQWVELEVLLENNGCYIQAEKPIGVCTYLTSDSYNQVITGKSNSDPAQAWLPSIEQSVNSALIAPFMPSTETKLNAHYALIITPTVAKDSTKVSIGGAAATALKGGKWYDNAAANMSFYSMPLAHSTASYLFTNKTEGLIVMGYGTGPAVSYYYLSASGMRSLDMAFYVNALHYQDLNSNYICTQSLQFRAEINSRMSTNVGYLKWYINNVEDTTARDSLVWSKNLPDGIYQVKMFVLASNNSTTDTVETTIRIQQAKTLTISDTSLSYCERSPAPTLLSATGAAPDSGYTLKWYLSDGITTTNASNLINTNTVGLNKYYVSQTNNHTNCESDKIPIEITIKPVNFTILFDTTCPNHAYANHGFNIPAEELKEIGTFNFAEKLTNTAGCDSIITLKLTVKPYSYSKGKSQFPGGDRALTQFLKKNLQYPQQAKRMDVEGTVKVNFVVAPDGKITNVKILESVHPLLDEEVLRVIDLMPKWIPSECAYDAYSLPIEFELKDPVKRKRWLY